MTQPDAMAHGGITQGDTGTGTELAGDDRVDLPAAEGVDLGRLQPADEVRFRVVRGADQVDRITEIDAASEPATFCGGFGPAGGTVDASGSSSNGIGPGG
ncbi:hypothetical protein [Thiococcus pfennigii]|jgi:hypothetical protein|uniref:hypothetical protein n=1 Tax=Thiococcus pfennigii TaxID=1057 RepID=UPI001903B966|nr:hypothetical protein [Thiococcus pfennigii]